MRNIVVGWSTLAGALLVVGSGVGCGDGNACDYDVCTDATSTASGGSGSTGSGGSGGEGGQGGSGGTDPGCVPSALEGGVPLADTCGVFVDASKRTDGDGTQGKPYTSLTAAIQAGGGKPIFVCAAATAARVTGTLASSRDIFGGVDCGTWTYTGTQSPVEGEANTPALRIEGADVTSRLEDLAVNAADATEAGAHSVAVQLVGAKADLARVTLRAGKGLAGADGADGGAQVRPNPDMDGAEGSVAGTNPPTQAAGGTNTCGAFTLLGGGGGKGGLVDSMPGESGVIGDAGNGGLPGQGQDMQVNYNCAPGANGGGFPGDDAEDGAPGSGGSALGVLGAAGVTGRDGEDGQGGTNGKSGGGGGGSKASPTVNGAGGGGGGAGGCAGKVGRGGQAGGSSIALLSVNATVGFGAEVVLIAGTGGKGGAGGSGQFGQAGGQGLAGGGASSPVKKGCDGGDGSAGGDGGNGGGGSGGHAIGFAHIATAATGEAVFDISGAAAGDPGSGGTNEGASAAGFPGEAGTAIGDQAFD